jgi:hypothetical protein
MRGAWIAGSALLLAAGWPVARLDAAPPDYRLEDSRSTEGLARRELRRVVVIGLTDDREVRHRFEDKFTTHLRGRGVMASASHPVIEWLNTLPRREEVLAYIEREGIDAVITVRPVPVDAKEDAAWAGQWEAWVQDPGTARELIERSVPVPAGKHERYGIEFALWDAAEPRCLWAGRSGVYTRKQLRQGVGDLLQVTILALRDAGWVP